MAGNLILKGDIHPGGAFARYLPLSLVMGALGVFLIVIGAIVTQADVLRMVGYRNYEMAYVMIKIFMLGLGFGFVVLALVIPFAAASDAKKCFVDVYDDCVRGAYREGVGKETHFAPFSLTYDMIQGVFVQKTDVFIQIAGRTLRTRALNAEQIANAISYRMQMVAAPSPMPGAMPGMR